MANYDINQTIRFLVVGGTTFFIDMALLLVFVKYFDVYYLISTAIAFLVASLINYYLSIIMVFETGKYSSRKKELVVFFIFTFLGVTINHIIIYICSNILMLRLFVSKLVSVFVVTVFNFLTKKHIVFLN